MVCTFITKYLSALVIKTQSLNTRLLSFEPCLYSLAVTRPTAPPPRSEWRGEDNGPSVRLPDPAHYETYDINSRLGKHVIHWVNMLRGSEKPACLCQEVEMGMFILQSTCIFSWLLVHNENDTLLFEPSAVSRGAKNQRAWHVLPQMM